MRHRVEDAVQNLIALAIICNACAPACAAEDHEELHGVNHPPVSIQLASDPLKLTRVGEMELTFHLRGLLPGFTYLCNTVVHAYGLDPAIFMEDDAFPFDADVCNASVRSRVWSQAPGDALVILLGGHEWVHGVHEDGGLRGTKTNTA